MVRLVTVILILLTFGLVSSTSKQEKPDPDFQTKIDSFIKKYSTDFTIVTETFNSNGNDFILDKKVKSSWNKTLTLKQKASFKNKYDQIVHQRLFLGFYQYETEEQCLAALMSLLDCFGTDCDKLKWGVSGKYLKVTPTLYLINKKEIIVCKIHCEHSNDFWKAFKQDLTNTFGNLISRIIESDCGGPVNFR